MSARHLYEGNTLVAPGLDRSMLYGSTVVADVTFSIENALLTSELSGVICNGTGTTGRMRPETEKYFLGLGALVDIQTWC